MEGELETNWRVWRKTGPGHFLRGPTNWKFFIE
jgi:hypothetical protein